MNPELAELKHQVDALIRHRNEQINEFALAGKSLEEVTTSDEKKSLEAVLDRLGFEELNGNLEPLEAEDDDTCVCKGEDCEIMGCPRHKGVANVSKEEEEKAIRHLGGAECPSCPGVPATTARTTSGRVERWCSGCHVILPEVDSYGLSGISLEAIAEGVLSAKSLEEIDNEGQSLEAIMGEA